MTSTKPLVLMDGTVVRDLVVRFEGGRAVEVQASEGGETLRTIVDDRRRRRAARRGARWSTARGGSASSGRSSTTRCSTRTPPATSRSARASRSCSTRRPRALQRERDPHRLHDRRPTSWRSPASPRRASGCPCWSRGAGRSERLPCRPPGEVPERLNGHDWKSCDGETRPGFESLSLRWLSKLQRDPLKAAFQDGFVGEVTRVPSSVRRRGLQRPRPPMGSLFLSDPNGDAAGSCMSRPAKACRRRLGGSGCCAGGYRAASS